MTPIQFRESRCCRLHSSQLCHVVGRYETRRLIGIIGHALCAFRTIEMASTILRRSCIYLTNPPSSTTDKYIPTHIARLYRRVLIPIGSRITSFYDTRRIIDDTPARASGILMERKIRSGDGQQFHSKRFVSDDSVEEPRRFGLSVPRLTPEKNTAKENKVI